MGLKRRYLYVISIYDMQSKSKLARLSRYRAALREAIDELAELIEVGYERKPMVKGSRWEYLYELARKCGKAGCACTRGQLHRSMVLSWSEEGRTRLLSIPAERVKGLREKSERYTQYRAARAEVTRVQRRILKLLDQIEKLRREKP